MSEANTDTTPSTEAATAEVALTDEQAVVELSAGDLPAFCPNPRMPLWSSHPRVFLDLAHTGQAACAYCGTQYRLAPGTVIKGH